MLFEQPVLDADATTPDGLTGAVHGAPQLVDLTTGETTTLAGCDWYWIGPFEWPEPGTGCGDGVIPQYWTVQTAADGSVLAYKDPTGADLLYQPGSLWDIQTGAFTEAASAIALSSDGTTLIELADDDSTDLRVTDIATGTEIARFESDEPVTQLRFDADSGLILGATSDATLMIVDPETWDVTNLAGSAGGEIVDVDGSPDGRWVATVGTSGVVVVWDVVTGSVVAEIPIHGLSGEGLHGVVFLDDATVLVAPESGTHLLRFSLSVETCGSEPSRA